MSAKFVLCANPFCIILLRDGKVFHRRGKLPDEQRTKTKEETDWYLYSARYGHGARRVVDQQGNFSPEIPDGIRHPMVREMQLDSGEWVWVMLPEEMG
jgi:hypothetical protein